MKAPPWIIRIATVADRKRLAGFSCADPGRPWELEVERFVRADLLSWAWSPGAVDQDPRLLLLLDRKTGALVGVAAHELAKLSAPGGVTFGATKLQVAAIAASWQGKKFGSGPRASDVLVSAVMSDISRRVPKRDTRVFAVVHEKNGRSIALCRRHGLVDELSPPAPQYRRLITKHRP